MKTVSLKTNFVAHPRNDRFHKSTVPLGGGVAIFFTIAAAALAAIAAAKLSVRLDWLAALIEPASEHIAGFLSRLDELIVIMLAATALHILGLIDDKKHIGPINKLIVEFALAFAAAYLGDVRVELFIESRILTSIISSFWIVLLINAFNFLDNIDGAAAGIAAIAAAILFIIAALGGQVFVSGLAMVYLAALLGFLIFNFFPASIFMGDAGSLIVGFFAAVLSLRTTYYYQSANQQWYMVLMPLIIMAIPLYDFISVSILRISQGKSPLVGDTQHFSHRLKKRGLTDVQVVLTLYLATLCTAVGAVALRWTQWPGAVLIFAQTVLILLIVAILEMAGKTQGETQSEQN